MENKVYCTQGLSLNVSEWSNTNNMEEKKINEEGSEVSVEITEDRGKNGIRNKKSAVILLAVLLALLAVVGALATIDYDSLFDKVIARPPVNYYEPAIGENIWENEEYMAFTYGSMLSVNVCEDGFFSNMYTFEDAESAEEAFEKAGKHQNGMSVLSDYFYTLLCGCDTPAEKSRFKALFSEEFQINRGKRQLAGAFPAQKIYDLHFDYVGEDLCYDKQTSCYVWLVSYRIVRNDGTVLNYSSGLEHGKARFYVEQRSDGGYSIKEIVGIDQVN